MYINKPKEQKKLYRAKKTKVNFLAIALWMTARAPSLYV
jgi:hypothetical protein